MLLLSCPLGCEDLLEEELVQLGADAARLRRAPGAVTVGEALAPAPTAPDAVRGSTPDADELTLGLAACLRSRLASRVAWVVARFACTDADALYAGMARLPWAELLDPKASFAIDCPRGEGSLHHTQYAAQVAKDGIVDVMRRATGARPDVDLRAPDVRVLVLLRRGVATVALDLAGEALHRRGYRQDGGEAPLKENLAVAILLRAGWPKAAAAGAELVDPMCGSGTLLIEGAWMALGVPPSALRRRYGADALPWLDRSIWAAMRNGAAEDAKRALAAPGASRIFGADADEAQLMRARASIDAAKLGPHVALRRAEVARLRRPNPQGPGLLVCNPPYGERLAPGTAALMTTYAALGDALRRHPGYSGHVLLGERNLGHALGLRAHKVHSLRNGPLQASLLHFVPRAEAKAQAARRRPAEAAQGAADAGVANGAPPTDAESTADGTTETDLSTPASSSTPAWSPTSGTPPSSSSAAAPAAPAGVPPNPAGDAVVRAAARAAAPTGPDAAAQTMVENRLRKNLRRLDRWLTRDEVHAFRAYDADLPEYNAAIDVYREKDGPVRLHVQEYAAPASVPVGTSERRLRVLVQAAVAAFGVHPIHVHLKVRRRQQPEEQYGPRGRATGARAQGRRDDPQFFAVEEAGLTYWVSLDAYIDTGLYLDHRTLRAKLRGMAEGADVLNLFCYTASVSVACAAGRARSTTSVDLSKTYLRWAADNLAANGFVAPRHGLVHAEVEAWVAAAATRGPRYDLIYCGPPTFTNSRRADQDFDVVRDHARLVQGAMRLLRPGGTLVFTSHARKLQLDDALQQRFAVTDWTKATLPPDFSRRRPHQTYCIRTGEADALLTR